MVHNDPERDWEVTVVGAGVAGAMAALHLARAGLRVLLVEKSAWPRDKACGGCLNAAALRSLARAEIELRDGTVLTRMHLACRGRTASLPLPRGIAMSRKRLDGVLVAHAVDAGVRFLPATRAMLLGAPVDSGCHLALRNDATQCEINARVVLDCGGLATRLLPDASWRVARSARIGVAVSIPRAPPWCAAGVIHMACSTHGYAGVVRAEEGTANIAAALDPVHCRRAGGPARVVAEILGEAGFPALENLHRLDWCGTPYLTRTRCRRDANPRVLVLGDAAGYAEPFTGEGMAWALADAAAVQPFAREAAARRTHDAGARWNFRQARMMRTRQRVCRGVAKWLRHPGLVSAMLPLLDAAPAVTLPLTAWLNRDADGCGVVAE